MMKSSTNIVKHATMCHMSKAHSFKDDFTAAFEGNVNETIERNVSKLTEKFGFILIWTPSRWMRWHGLP